MQSLIETTQRELARLRSYTDEIGKAQQIADQVQEAAASVVKAAASIDQRQQELLDELRDEHLRQTHEQTATLRTAAQEQSAQTEQLLRQELTSLRHGTETVVQALHHVLEEQPRILSTISTQHEQSVGTQTDLLRQTLTESAVILDAQFTRQFKGLQQTKDDFTTAFGKQLDGFTTLTDRLQVISASLTAFRDSMNAAKFSDRLESLDSQQGSILNHLSKLDELLVQNGQLATKIISLKTQNTLIVILAGISILVSIGLRFI